MGLCQWICICQYLKHEKTWTISSFMHMFAVSVFEGHVYSNELTLLLFMTEQQPV